MEHKIKHLEMIQNVIERMARNSFQLKGWTMILVSVVGTLATQSASKKCLLFAFIPVLGFILLDTFYLQQERKYRQLYKNVTLKKEEEIDFNLNANLAIGDANEMKRLCFFNCLCSFSILVFYIAITAALIALLFILNLS